MHEKRIMHRDLKPANIFLTLDGTIKIGDFGLSRELSEHTFQAHSKVGTPLYMSPEVLRGDGYDFKSDIWSVGCLLYELSMLKSPFKVDGLNLYSLFQKISKGDFEPISDHYSEELRQLAYSMISIKAEERPNLVNICAVAQEMKSKFDSLKGLNKEGDKSLTSSTSFSRTFHDCKESKRCDIRMKCVDEGIVNINDKGTNNRVTLSANEMDHGAMSPSQFIQLEAVLMKLDTLGYFQSSSFTRNYIIPCIALKTATEESNFRTFMKTMHWLLTLDFENIQSTGVLDEEVDSNRDEITIASDLINFSINIGLTEKWMDGILPVSLAQGSGVAVNQFLNSICENLLRKEASSRVNLTYSLYQHGSICTHAPLSSSKDNYHYCYGSKSYHVKHSIVNPCDDLFDDGNFVGKYGSDSKAHAEPLPTQTFLVVTSDEIIFKSIHDIIFDLKRNLGLTAISLWMGDRLKFLHKGLRSEIVSIPSLELALNNKFKLHCNRLKDMGYELGQLREEHAHIQEIHCLSTITLETVTDAVQARKVGASRGHLKDAKIVASLIKSRILGLKAEIMEMNARVGIVSNILLQQLQSLSKCKRRCDMCST